MSYEPPDDRKQPEPWWNDGDKVGGLAATVVLLTLVIVVCLGVIALAAKFFF